MWHKHYTDARFVPQNFQNALGGRKLPQLQKILDEELGSDGKPIRKEQIGRVRERFDEAFMRRSRAGRLTGEWIVYLPYRGKNYYLCLGNHNDIPSIYHKVHACQYEAGFKNVLKWWGEVRGAPIAPLSQTYPILASCWAIISLALSCKSNKASSNLVCNVLCASRGDWTC